MKKAILFVCALLLQAVALRAVPAYPYPVRVTQPDGSVITVQLHGDEFYHWTTSDGYVVERDEKGFYRRVGLVNTRSVPRNQQAIQAAMAARRENEQRMRQRALPFTKGKSISW